MGSVLQKTDLEDRAPMWAALDSRIKSGKVAIEELKAQYADELGPDCVQPCKNNTRAMVYALTNALKIAKKKVPKDGEETANKLGREIGKDGDQKLRDEQATLFAKLHDFQCVQSALLSVLQFLTLPGDLDLEKMQEFSIPADKIKEHKKKKKRQLKEAVQAVENGDVEHLEL